MASKKQIPTNNGNSGTLSLNRALDDALVEAFMQELEKDPSPIASGGKRKKLKVVKNKEAKNEIIELKESMNVVAEALREGNAAIREGNEITRERHKHELPPISGEETWNLIKECGCDTDSLTKIYCAVMKDKDKLRMILQCPPEACKAVIMQMVSG
ncbi:hypothetical protein MTR_1g111490 [Medicago truncatula]|uniref:Uncharacterized protein n=1 Tax=Medicago truncatula TaxID=3880 RepID=A0A072VS57_MEDTR|nr:hypothetical protein MTR_1g111490 [Medicago truncatula]